MCLHFLLAVAKIVVGDHRYDDTFFVTTRQLKRAAIVVEIRLVVPTHTVANLTLSRVVNVRQADLFLGDFRQVRCEDDATGVSCPMLDIESGVVLG